MSKHLLFSPSAGLDWEIWSLHGGSRTPTLEGKTTEPADAAAAASRVVMALPVSQCLTLPLWLTNAEPGLYEPMILSQLEKRGMAPRNGTPPIFDYGVVAVSENRTLLRVTLLPGNFPEALCFAKARCYAGWADFLPLPESQIVLWQERQNLVLAVARGGEVVYTQVLSRSLQITAETALEVRAIRLALEAEQVVESITGVTVWGSFPEGVDCLQLLKLPVDEGERPAPSAARVATVSTRSRMVPLPLQKTRILRLRRDRNLRFAGIAALGYVALVLLMAVYLRSLQAKASALVESVKRDKPAATELERTSAAWRVVESAVDPNYYAIEQFYLCAEALPPVGIRFSSFEIKGRGVQIKGMARSVAELYKYVDVLKQSPVISRNSWRVGQPRVFQDDTVEFKIEGNMQ